MSNYEYQRKHLREWATKHIVECDSLSTGLLQSPFSSVYFGDNKSMRFTGSLPGSGCPPDTYAFYFYPLGKPGVFITNIEGELFGPPFTITTQINEPDVLAGTLVLKLESDEEKWVIIAETDLMTPDGTCYKGRYYLFTLPPLNLKISPPKSEELKSKEKVQRKRGRGRLTSAGFMPTIIGGLKVLFSRFRKLLRF